MPGRGWERVVAMAKHVADLVVDQVLTVDMPGARKGSWRLGPVVCVDVHVHRGCPGVCDAQTSECRKAPRNCIRGHLMYDKVNARARLTDMNKHKPFIFPAASIRKCSTDKPKLSVGKTVRCVAQAHLSLYITVFRPLALATDRAADRAAAKAERSQPRRAPPLHSDPSYAPP